MFVHVFFLFPETAGKTLEETEAMFLDPTGPRYVGTPAWKTRVQTSTIARVERGDIPNEKLANMHVEDAGKESE